MRITDFLKVRSVGSLSVSPDGRMAMFWVVQPELEDNAYHRELYVRDLTDAAAEPRPVLARDVGAGMVIWLDERTIGVPVRSAEKRIAYRTLDAYDGTCSDSAVFPEGALDAWRMADGRCAWLRETRLRRPEYPEEVAFLNEYEDGFESIDELPAYRNGSGFLSGRRISLFVGEPGGTGEQITAPETTVDAVRRCPEGLYIQARTYRGRDAEAGILFLENGSGTLRTIVPGHRYRVHAWDAGLVDGHPTVTFAAHDNRVHTMSDDPAFYQAAGGEVRKLDIAERTVGDATGHDCVYGEGRSLIRRGDDIWFITTRPRDSVVVRVKEGEEPVVVSPEHRSITDFAVLTDGSLPMITMDAFSAQELAKFDGAALTRLTAFNEGALDEGDIIRPIPYEFESGGFTVHYLAIPPAGYDPSKKYPAIVYIHGGAKMTYTDVFFHEMQYLASKGYFVLYGNPRGSDGQGSEFANLLGHYGEQDYADVMRATDEALKRWPAIDPARLGVAGGSYGGILTNWIVTHTDRFAAAVAQRSICSMVSTYGTADNGWNFVREQMDGDLWEGFDNLWRQSPLKYANHCHTPLLLIHSDEDYRCHVTEAFQMFTALKSLGVECEVCMIRGENHNLSRSGRPAQRIKRLYEIGRWFDAHLKAAEDA